MNTILYVNLKNNENLALYVFKLGAIHKVRTLGRGRGDQAKSVQVRTRGELMPKTYVRLKKKMRVYFERYCI